MKHVDKTFSGGEVEIDGEVFENCNFENCSLVYSGGATPQFTGCGFGELRVEFRGSANNTVNLLQAMASPNSGFQEAIRNTFPALGAD